MLTGQSLLFVITIGNRNATLTSVCLKNAPALHEGGDAIWSGQP